jgi:RNA polymerase sigma factor (sigma-70 family)
VNPDPTPVSPLDPLALLRQMEACVDSLYADCLFSAWGLTRSQFTVAVERSVAKRFAEFPCNHDSLKEYLATLHADDLALATACMNGSETAWEYFVKTYRNYLRAAAGIITKGGKSGADAQELADSLFAELFGLVDGKRGEASLFRYFHGRSSLKTWLRTVLAQRHIDRIRQSRRWQSFEREDGEERNLPPAQVVSTSSLDPHRADYLRRFLLALNLCMRNLEPIDRKRLELYYAREKTLAEIGRLLGEHESSVSRHLERARRELRSKIEECLRTGSYVDGEQSQNLPPMSDAQIALCFQYASEDSPIDFRQMFPEKPAKRSEAGRKESS